MTGFLLTSVYIRDLILVPIVVAYFTFQLSLLNIQLLIVLSISSLYFWRIRILNYCHNADRWHFFQVLTTSWISSRDRKLAEANWKARETNVISGDSSDGLLSSLGLVTAAPVMRWVPIAISLYAVLLNKCANVHIKTFISIYRGFR